MDVTRAFGLFNTLISEAEKELINSTVNSGLTVRRKADTTFVTQCDLAINEKLGDIATQSGFRVISEENDHETDTVTSGNYITVDPIDGTLGYIEYVSRAFNTNTIENFLDNDLGPEHDFCLLLGVVIDGQPAYGACYNYITKEKILIDAASSHNLIRENNVRNFSCKLAFYRDIQPTNDPVSQKISEIPGITIIKEAPIGLRSLYTLLNPHDAAIAVHRSQSAGLWDITPAAAAARAFGGSIYDDTGKPLMLTEYINLPGSGVSIIKGDLFTFVPNLLQEYPMP